MKFIEHTSMASANVSCCCVFVHKAGQVNQIELWFQGMWMRSEKDARNGLNGVEEEEEGEEEMP